MNELTDSELRSRYDALRTADAANAPGFRELLDRATRAAAATDRSARRRLPRLAVPIALAATIALAVGIARMARRRASIQTPLSTWTSPTARLLRTSGIGLAASPGVLTSVLDRATSPHVPLNGTRQ